MSTEDEVPDHKMPTATGVRSTRKPFNPSLTEAAKARLAVRRPSRTALISRAKTKREAEQAEARALGVRIVNKVRADRSWSHDEDSVIHTLYPDYKAMQSKLPHRSKDSIKRRADKIGINKGCKNTWLASDLAKLKKNYAKSDLAALLAMFPGRTARQIRARANHSGLHKTRIYASTGNSLLDSIRQRCLELNYTMGDLDAMACTGSYFRESRWHCHNEHSSSKMTLAIKALGGRLTVIWD